MPATPSRILRLLAARPLLRAEIACASWEVFSVLLCAAAVIPASIAPGPASTFAVLLAASAALAPRLLRYGERGATVASGLRVIAWPASLLALPGPSDLTPFVPAFAFGLMAAAVRRALYRRALEPNEPRAADALADTLRARVAENAALGGIVGGHILVLFSVAFLRTQSQVMFRGWWSMVPILGVIGTVGFTIAVRPLTRHVLRALRAGPDGPRDVIARGLEQARGLASTLGLTNFVTWLTFVTIGVFYFRTGPAEWNPSDAVMQLLYGAVFSWGVSFYQRGLHEDAVRPVIATLGAWRRDDGPGGPPEIARLEQRMLRDFGLPYAFTAVLSLLSAIALYRTLAVDLTWREDFNSILALVTSFTMLGLAVGSVIVRVAREIARPLGEVAEAAEIAAKGDLETQVPVVGGAVEVVGLAASVERMRRALSNTIAELEDERKHLEANVEARTAELQRALRELRDAQTALVHTERLASLGELVAGIAHEIGNPLNAIAGSSEPLEQLARDVREMLDAYRQAEGDLPPAKRAEIEALRQSLELEATLDDLGGISTVIRRATERSVRIVQNLKNFSRTTGEPLPSDLHAGLDETLQLLGPRLRHASIQVTKEYGANVPLVVCRAGDVNQVFLNGIVNAIQALESDAGAGHTIHIATRVEGADVLVTIEDDGPGVAPGIEKRIFDPFFTTKPRGQGTGLGLSISTEIMRRHGGSIAMERPGERGARLVCRLPIDGPSRNSRESQPPVPSALRSPKPTVRSDAGG